VHHINILAGDSVSLVSDAHRLPFQDNSIESQIYQAVLEHVQYPRRVIDEATRVLKPGSYLYLEFSFLQGFHSEATQLPALRLGRVARAYQGIH
jgi:ubiquinone/menaquinone biosynthesis C-methylase UbiE